MDQDYEYNDGIYTCKKCSGRFTVFEMPCGVSGPGCKDREEVECPHCGAFMFSRMKAGKYFVSARN